MITPQFKDFLHNLISDNSQALIQHWLSFFVQEEQELQHRYYADFLSFFDDCVMDSLEFHTDSYHALFNFMVKLSELIEEEQFYNFRSSVFTCYLKFPLFHLMEEKNVFTFNHVATLTAFFESLTSRVMLHYVRERKQIEETTNRELKEREAPMSIIGTGVLMVSIMGTLDSQRIMVIIDRVLEKIEKAAIKHVIIDINALSEMNLEVANQLLMLNKAINLMGSRAYLTGMTKQVAKSLICLDITLGDIHTYSSVKDALQGMVVLVDSG